jgi:bifunctional DNA-binding transcriptional regulator/antitoxin component of YhaV-PrlF toxin-antitoxin module
MADTPPLPQTEWLADASVSASGGMNLPVEARRHLGLDGAATVLVFGQPGRVILAPVGMADELLEFAAARAAARKNESS